MFVLDTAGACCLCSVFSKQAVSYSVNICIILTLETHSVNKVPSAHLAVLFPLSSWHLAGVWQ